MWKYLSTRAPAFRNFRLVAPIDVDESKDLRRGKDRIEADEYVFMYGASRACSERFSLAFHGMRSCFKILANLASLSLSSPPIFRAACLFGQCRSRRNRLFPPFLFFLLFPFALVNNAIYIYSTEKYTDVSPARWHFRFPHSPPLFRGSPLPTGISSMAEKRFHQKPTQGVYSTDLWHPFESLFSALSSLDVAFVAMVQRDSLAKINEPPPRQSRSIPLPRTEISSNIFLALTNFSLDRESIHREFLQHRSIRDYEPSRSGACVM